MLDKRNVCNIVEIDYASEICAESIFSGRSVVGREHDRTAYRISKDKLCFGRAVKAESVVIDDVQDIRVRCGLYGKILVKTFIPCKSFLNSLAVLTDALLIVNVKRCGIRSSDLFDLALGNKRLLFHSKIPSKKTYEVS